MTTPKCESNGSLKSVLKNAKANEPPDSTVATAETPMMEMRVIGAPLDNTNVAEHENDCKITTSSVKRATSLRFQRLPSRSPDRECDLTKKRENSSSSMGSSQKSRTRTSYKRWSSMKRRRYSYARSSSIAGGMSSVSRRLSTRMASEDLDDLPYAMASGTNPCSDFSLLECVPTRPHGLCVAVVTSICSLAAVVTSVAFLLRNALLWELVKLPPGCTPYSRLNSTTGTYSLENNPSRRSTLSPETNLLSTPPEKITLSFLAREPTYSPEMSREANISNCSAVVTAAYILGFGMQRSSTFNDIELEIPATEYFFLSESFLWFTLCLSVLFFWSGVCLFKGLWFLQRRKLLPFLLVSGVTVLFFIMASVWYFVCFEGWNKLRSLVPCFFALLFLYWWMLINRLLEEIHEDKKFEASNHSIFAAVSESNLAATAATIEPETLSNKRQDSEV